MQQMAAMLGPRRCKRGKRKHAVVATLRNRLPCRGTPSKRSVGTPSLSAGAISRLILLVATPPLPYAFQSRLFLTHLRR